MSDAPRGFKKDIFSCATIAVIHLQNSNTLQVALVEDVVGQGVALLPIVGKIVQQPWDASLRHGGVVGCRIHDWKFELQGGSQLNMGGGGIDRAQHGHVVIFVDHVDDRHRRSAPQRQVVMHFQCEGLAVISALGVGFFYRHLRSMQHGNSVRRIDVICIQRP